MSRTEKRIPSPLRAFFLVTVCWIVCALLGRAATTAYFNKPVDKRFAWLNNDAHGDADFQTELRNLILSATTSVDVCTMSLGGVDDVAQALVTAARDGRQVRIMGNSGHRYSDGYFTTLHGPLQLADNNLSALVCRVNFQSNTHTVPTGFLPDYGDLYGPRGGGMTYGWLHNATGDIKTTAHPADYTALLGDCYAKTNSAGTMTWEIAVPNGYYYVLAATGEADFNSKSFVWAEGQTIFTYMSGGVLHYSDHTDTAAGEFKCSVVDGGMNGAEYTSRRVQVSDGKLTITIGKSGETSWSSLNFLEIYRGCATIEGDHGTDKQYVQERQLQHSKFVLIDGGTPNAKLWTGSGNLTAAMLFLSEDAILTDEPLICDVFYQEFNQMWGGSGAAPNPAAAAAGRFKTAMSTATHTIAAPYFGAGVSFPWQVHFSPSQPPALNLYSDLSGHIASAQHNLIMLLEQWTESADLSPTLRGSTYLMQHDLENYVTSGKPFYGLFGNESATDAIFTHFAGHANAHILRVPTVSGVYGIHDKFALVDAYRDTRYARRGSLLFGSMNWSQGGMHANDEQTLIVRDPALANQYLQRAMAALKKEGMVPPPDSDIIIVLDRSYSMTALCADGVTTKIEAMKSAAKMFIDLLDQNGTHRMSIVRFGRELEPNFIASTATLQPLVPGQATQLKNEIDNIQPTLPLGDGTCYGAALSESLARFTGAVPAKPRRLILFFTDGLENRAPMAAAAYPGLVTAGVEIHSVAFGAFSPFGGGGPTAVLSDMALASAGSFAQMDTDPVKLKKRFAEVAGDVMSASVVLDPLYQLTAEKPLVRVAMPETGRSLRVIQLGEARSADVRLQPFAVDAKGRSTPLEHGVSLHEDKGYRVWTVDPGKARLGDTPWALELRPQRPLDAKQAVRLHLMILADVSSVIQAEVCADPPGGHGVTLLARLLSGNEPLKAATIHAAWTTPPMEGHGATATDVPLFDDGQHGDGAPGDGLFGARLELKESGNHAFHLVGLAAPRRVLEPGKKIKPTAALEAEKAEIAAERLLPMEHLTAVKLLRRPPRLRRETTVYYTVNR